ncbi:AMP-binding protein [Hoeflea alexandrii]|uniref:AMP-binding protein n=1 Tax=Hoeflea alexandrii TaxID=288436 RepID=UPI0022703296|nr:AMP-binding protein [Hoeflea alexandrii]MCY0155003.1 AMP-binding protein [Hoeflea alexandrii]
MLDLGRSFLASVARDPNATALVDGDLALTYAEWLPRVGALADGLQRMGISKGDRLVTILQNTADAATLHWACQFAGVVIVPINWRVTPEDLDFVLENAEGAAIVFDASSMDAVKGSRRAAGLPWISAGAECADATAIAELYQAKADPTPMAGPDDLSLMFYTSGTTAKPKGVPRKHYAERAAALAHVAQNLMPQGERTLGVMPVYHTMGVRSLLAMALLGGRFVCLPKFDVITALKLIEDHEISSLYLVPTLFHDLVGHENFATTNISSVRRLGFAGASMTDGLLRRLNDAFKPDLFVNHYGSSEVYTFSINQNAALKQGSAGRAGLNQHLRVVTVGSGDPNSQVLAGEEGEIIATLSGDEAFEGYWRRPEADAKALRGGWYFTGDLGRMDTEGDLFVTGRVDDMIISGGENVSPIEVENCLSLLPNVGECAVVGLPDERWGKVVTAFVRRSGPLTPDEIDEHCRKSGLSGYKRPRRIVFVADLPKSPVGKLLRRVLADGTFTPETPDASGVN